jgi:hypothetical protein
MMMVQFIMLILLVMSIPFLTHYFCGWFLPVAAVVFSVAVFKRKTEREGERNKERETKRERVAFCPPIPLMMPIPFLLRFLC